MPSHLDEKTLRQFAAGRLDEEQESQVESHLAVCPECLRRLHDVESNKPNQLFEGLKAARFDDSAASETLEIKAETKNSDDDGFAPGDMIGGNYRLEAQLGHGGMGIAWKAFDETAQRYVVLKFVPKEILHISEAMNSVRDSFQKVHALQHQHICPLYGLFNDPKCGLFLVMKYVDGITLDVYRKKHTPISFDDVVRILDKIADALDYAHARKVIHRDIKPANIMIGEKDGVQIIDFGLADEIRESLSLSGNSTVRKISGTRSYMSPEQWEGKRQNAKTDQYALAVTAYEMLAGHVPFSGSDTEILQNCVLHVIPERIKGLPDYINDALGKALSKKPKDRFGSCAAFVGALTNRSIDKSKMLPWKAFATIFIAATIIILAAFLLTPKSSELNDSVNHIITEKIPLQEKDVVENPSAVEIKPPATFKSIKDFLSTSQEQIVIPTKISTPLISVIRMTLEIDRDGKGRLGIERGATTDSLEGFRGTSFPNDLFPNVQAFHSENGMGRVFFDFRATTWDKAWRGEGRMRSWSRFQNYSYAPHLAAQAKSDGQRIEVSSQGNTTLQYRGVGIGLGKGRLPCRIAVEIVEKHGVLPDIEIELVHVDKAEGMVKSSFVRGSAVSENNGRLSVEGSFTLPNEWDRTYFFDRAATDEISIAYFKEFQLPSDMIENVNHVVQYVRTGKTKAFQPGYEMYRTNGVTGFEIISFDIWGLFGGNTGLVVAEQEGNPVVQAIEPYDERISGSELMNGLKTGDRIHRFNGKELSATEIQRQLDTLNFGDPVEIEVLRDGESKIFNFYAE